MSNISSFRSLIVLFSNFLFAAGFKDILAGKEYSETLASLTSHMDTFRNLHNVQKEYLEATKRYKETAVGSRNKKSMQETRQKWFDLVSIYTDMTYQADTPLYYQLPS